MTRITVTCIMLITVCLTLIQIAGCSSGGGGYNPDRIGDPIAVDTPKDTGTLTVAITGKPSDSFAQVVIAIKEVRAVPAGKENAPDNDPSLPDLTKFTLPEVIDVMPLHFKKHNLSMNTVFQLIPTGSYRQIRLILELNGPGQPVNYLTLKNDPATKIPLNWLNGQQSGLKLRGAVEVVPGYLNNVMIDFDPNTAIVELDNVPQSEKYVIDPNGIRLVQNDTAMVGTGFFGTISGTVQSALINWSSATVRVERRGQLTDTIIPVATGWIYSNHTSGQWRAPFSVGIPQIGQQIPYKAFIAVNGFRAYSSQLLSVVQGQATSLGTIALTPLP